MEGIIVAIITGVFSFITFLLTRFFTIRDRKLKEEKEKDERYDQLKQRIEEEENRIKDLESLSKKFMEKQIQNTTLLETVSSAIQATLRNDIIKMYKEYYEEKHYMPIYERENLNHLTQKYYSLDGNGVVPSLVEKLYSLGTEPPENN